jgi:hypothetical protein
VWDDGVRFVGRLGEDVPVKHEAAQALAGDIRLVQSLFSVV